MMSILGGEWRGRKIQGADSLRPSTSRVKASIFSIIEAIEWKRAGESPTYENWRILDLFAGVGGLGLEMLSRGSVHCSFVEKEKRHAQILRANISSLDCNEKTEVIVADVLKLDWTHLKDFSLVFIDPPYSKVNIVAVLESIVSHDALCTGGIVLVEHDSKEKIAEVSGLKLHSSRTLGPAGITVFLAER